MASGCHIGRQRDSFQLSSVLSSALFEWLLMFLLFLNALFSYLVTKFARFCKLQTPCLLCSRLDHVFGNEKPGFYRDLICISHKLEISSLAYCHVHRKLANVKEMCEACLISFATEKMSNPETYRSLVGKLDVDLGDSVKLNGEDLVEVPLLQNYPLSGSLVTNHCSCCSMPFINKPCAVKLLENNPVRFDRLSKKIENSVGSPSTHHLGDHGFDRLSRVGYSEVKVTSDSESENPPSDNDDGNNLAEDLKEDTADRCLKPEPGIIIPDNLSMPASDDATLEKLIHRTSSKIESSLLFPEEQFLHAGESHDVSLASDVAIGHSLEEIFWNKNEVSNDSPALPEIISQKDSSEFSNVKLNGLIPSIGENANSLNSTTSDLASNQLVSDPGQSGPTHMDLNDAYKLAIGSKGGLTSLTVAEVITGRDSSKVYEDLRLLVSQFSAARGIDSPWNELSPSPRVLTQGDDFKFSDASSSAILQNITKSLSIDRNESGLESLDGSIVSEIEGESAVDRFKRQVELDRKSMYLMYKELEEERSASAIAANQAMAMITRLQEEKAAMHMEALQYQRVMEEQSEYDQEALQKLNELLVQREKEMQDLEAELETYRKRVGAKDGGFSNIEKNSSNISGGLLLGFDDEKAYISDFLKKLEEKLHMLSNNGMYVDNSWIDIGEDAHLDKSSEHENGEGSERKNGLYSETSSRLSPEGPIKENHKETLIHSDSYIDSHYSVDIRLSNLGALLNEISQLNERLKALEADHNFLEHTVNTLRTGNDGIQFIQEIACHLQELRGIGVTLR